MTGVETVSLVLLGIGIGTAAILALGVLVATIRRRLYARRWRVRQDVVIDLTFMSAAIQRDREIAETVARRRSTQPEMAGQRSR